MSAAGLARVNVTHRKLASDQDAKLLSSTITTSGKRRSWLLRVTAEQKWTISFDSDFRFWILDFGLSVSCPLSPVHCSLAVGPSRAMIPGSTRRGFLKPSGNGSSIGNSVGSSRRGGPAAATTTLEPILRASPE